MIRELIASVFFTFCSPGDFSLPPDSLHLKKLDQYAISILKQVPRDRRLIIKKYGKPIEIRSKRIENDYYPAQPDSSFELSYKNLSISILKISNKNEEYIEDISFSRGFKFISKPTFGSSLNSVQDYFGSTMNHTTSDLKYCIMSEEITPYYSLYFQFDSNGLCSIDLEIGNP